jgi:hypothetical protein
MAAARRMVGVASGRGTGRILVQGWSLYLNSGHTVGARVHRGMSVRSHRRREQHARRQDQEGHEGRDMVER